MLYSNVTDRINLINSNDAVLKKIDMHTYIYIYKNYTLYSSYKHNYH